MKKQRDTVNTSLCSQIMAYADTFHKILGEDMAPSLFSPLPTVPPPGPKKGMGLAMATGMSPDKIR